MRSPLSVTADGFARRSGYCCHLRPALDQPLSRSHGVFLAAEHTEDTEKRIGSSVLILFNRPEHPIARIGEPFGFTFFIPGCLSAIVFEV